MNDSAYPGIPLVNSQMWFDARWQNSLYLAWDSEDLHLLIARINQPATNLKPEDK